MCTKFNLPIQSVNSADKTHGSIREESGSFDLHWGFQSALKFVRRIPMFLQMFVIIVAVSGTGNVFAQSKVVWSFNAMAAAPAGASISENLYDALTGKVVFREGKTGNIALICPISDDLNGTHLRSLRLTYRDGDGKVGPSVVSASLRRVRKSDGHVETLPNGEVSSNDSNAFGSGPDGWITLTSGSPGHVLNHTLDLMNFYYYVQINLKRTDTNVPVGVMGVHLIN